MSSLKFGTSGLRGLVVDLVGMPSRSYALAFLRHVSASLPKGDSRQVVIGRDLRSSSETIAKDCAAAALMEGFTPVDCGELPTPALALEAQSRNCPAIMVTGSHIPDDRNGLKFYRPDGEITKDDEAGILAAYQGVSEADRKALERADPGAVVVDASRHAVDAYVARYVAFFGPGSLNGLKIGVYQQSSVARDILTRILSTLGADATPLGRADSFIPVDTEAHRPEDRALLSEWASQGSFDALVTTDGDADRPLVADSNGEILRGDVIGLLTASYLNLETIVTPITSGSVIEASGIAKRVVRTRVGSPFVISGMADAAKAGAAGIVGFEANGGVLLGSPAVREGRVLSALPTRDAMLPILSIVSMIKESGKPLGEILADLQPGHARADRLQEVPMASCAAFLKRLADDRGFANGHFAEAGSIKAVDCMDGVRVLLDEGSVVHYRASGNAPELRCYVEATQDARSTELLAWGLQAAKQALGRI